MLQLVQLLSLVALAAGYGLIIDTDMSTDVDDVGATCIANAMMDNGEVGRGALDAL